MQIKQNKGQTLLYCLISSAAALGLFCFVLFDMRQLPHDESVLLDNAVLFWGFRVLCLVCSVLCTICAVYCCKQLFSKTPLIEICDEYFYDRSSAISLGKIAWEDMEKAYVLGGFLNIQLKNPDTYISKMNCYQRMMIHANAKLGYGDVCISTQRFQKSKVEFFEEFSKRMPLGK